MEGIQTIRSLKEIIPGVVYELLTGSRSLTIYNNYEELADASTGNKENDYYEVRYKTGDGSEYTEAVVHRVTNGISANYTEACNTKGYSTRYYQ
jgi:hypothetical protein